jgi:DNA-binding NtrC family response regulator
VQRLLRTSASPSRVESGPLDVAGLNLIGRSPAFEQFLTSLCRTAQCDVLEDRTFKPLGSHHLRRVDVRVIAVSNQDLHRLLKEQAFRQDPLFRLDVAELVLPPLREREDDVALLAEHYLDTYARKLGQPRKRIHPDTLVWMRRYRWTGNVRELENFIQ